MTNKTMKRALVATLAAAAVLATAACSSTPAATGTAGVTAAKELPGIVAERDELRAVGLKRDLRAVLTEGFSSGRLTLGRATSQLPVALRGVAKTQWRAGCEAMAEQTQDAFLAAVEGVQLTADDLVALRESISAFQPRFIARRSPRSRASSSARSTWSNSSWSACWPRATCCWKASPARPRH